MKLAANLARNVEPIAMPETTEEYQKEFDLLIKQVQCKGNVIQNLFFKNFIAEKN